MDYTETNTNKCRYMVNRVAEKGYLRIKAAMKPSELQHKQLNGWKLHRNQQNSKKYNVKSFTVSYIRIYRMQQQKQCR
jgi:hypothetical protein